MKIKRYYIFEHNGCWAILKRGALPMGPMPILWCNAGMYAIIPGALLEELYDEDGSRDWTYRIWWEQCYELPQEVGRLLCDSTYNGE